MSTYFHTWCGLSANSECRSQMCCMGLAEYRGRKKSPKIHHLHTITQLCRAISSQLRHVSTIGKNLLNSNTSSTCPHNMVNFSPLTAEIGSLVWGTPANFNRFCILASLLHRRRSLEANQTLHDVWPSPVLVHYIYIFGSCCPLMEFCQVKIHFVSKSCILWYSQCYWMALQQRASARLCGVVQGMELQNFRRGRHLYSAGHQPTFYLFY